MSATPSEFRTLHCFLASRGVAHYLPTTVTADIDTTLRALERLADAIEAPQQPGEAHPVGVHLEGPFLSHAKRGVHPTGHLQPASIPLFDRLQGAARGHIRLLSLAPELPGALDLIAYATAGDVRVSLGHTDATFDETELAVDAGASSATHTFNAMRPLDHREPGALGAVLEDDRLYAELICDGVHVAPAAMRLWLRLKGPQRGILVTDAMSATGRGPGNYTLGGLPVTVTEDRALLTEALEAGRHTLAGSILTMDRAIGNLMRLTGADLRSAVAMATHTPAEMLGSPKLTTVEVGSPANLNRLDAEGRLLESCIRGRLMQPGAGL